MKAQLLQIPSMNRLSPILIAALLCASTLAIPAGELNVGAARVNITPPLGVPLAGYYHERGSDSVHDDLYAHAIVMEKDGVKAALISLDLITTRRTFVEQAREFIAAATAIPADHVMISATHAHTGPILPESTESRSQQRSQKGAQQYVAELPQRIAQAVKEADRALSPARASAAIGREETIAFNRRFHMTDGSVGWNPGKLNPNIIKPAGPIDSELPFVHFASPDDTPIATYVNYAVHLDNVGGLQISADLPFSLSQTLASVLGSEAVTVYVTGAAGDINHVNVNWSQAQKGHQNAARMGVILAGEVLRRWPVLKEVQGPLLARSETVSLSIPPVSPEEVVEAEKIIQTTKDDTRANFMRLVQAHKIVDLAAREGKPFEVEVQVITLGKDLAWVALPGEIFVQLGLDLKMDSPFDQTMIAELANGSIGYIPNVRAYPQGNYEVVSARCSPGSGEKLVETAIRLLKENHGRAQ